MVLESNTGRCANEEAKTRGGVTTKILGLKGGGLRDPTSVGEDNETFFIRVWKPLSIDTF